MKILLIDMDGVLVESHGYHRALQDAVALVGRGLGYREANVTSQDIAAFEAAGVPSEWDSSAICAALLLENLWPLHPTLTLPVDQVASVLPAHDILAPDFQPFIHSLAQADLQELPPLRRAEQLLMPNANSRTPEQRQALQGILRTARQMEGSLTHRIIQELVLGSQVFSETYGLSPSLHTESYLLQYDRGTLSDQASARLLDWLRAADHRAVVFTGRPSRPVGEHFSTPEAEMGAQDIGLGSLPVMGLGGLSWLSAQRGRDAEAFLKPSPVHALAAMRLALGDSLEHALEAAAALALDGRADDVWRALGEAQVYVFEDTAGGLKSVRAASELLAQTGGQPGVHLFGITDSQAKRQALEETGASVFPALSLALENVPGF